MNTAVVYFYKNNKNLMQKLSNGLAKGIQSQGHQADVIDGNLETEKRMFVYKYIVFGSETISAFGGKQPDSLKRFLKGASNLNGKRSCAFVSKSILGAQKSLSMLMAGMESEGMFLTYSEILNNETVAEEVGKKLKVQRAS